MAQAESSGEQKHQQLPVDTALLPPLTQELYEQFQARELDARDTAYLAVLLSRPALQDYNETTEASVMNARFNAVMQTDAEQISAANGLARWANEVLNDASLGSYKRGLSTTPKDILEWGGFEGSIINSEALIEQFSRGYVGDSLATYYLEKGDYDTAIDVLLHLTSEGDATHLVMDAWDQTHSPRLLPTLEAAIANLDPTKSIAETLPEFSRQADVLEQDIKHDRIRHMAGSNPARLSRWRRAAGLPAGRNYVRANADDIKDEAANKIAGLSQPTELTEHLRLHGIALEIDPSPEAQAAFDKSIAFVREGLGFAYDGASHKLKRAQRSHRLYLTDLIPTESDSVEQIEAKRSELLAEYERLRARPYRKLLMLNPPSHGHEVPKRHAVKYKLVRWALEEFKRFSPKSKPEQ